MKTRHSSFLLPLIFALSSIPVIYLLPDANRSFILKLIILPCFTIYGLFLCHINGKGARDISFPLFLLYLIMLIPMPSWGLLLLSSSIFSWIRSGICVTGKTSRKIMAESLCLMGWGGYFLYWSSGKPILLLMGTWFFFLSQSLYFYVVHWKEKEENREKNMDTFDRARFEIDRLFDS